ncbi:unnamed protein product, partial [Amoebophrya sp. A25]|eukprot:GSA25T00015231001.1
MVEKYASRGMEELYPWQQRCLQADARVLAGTRNLVYCAPTSGGKTLVAELLMLRAVTSGRGPALLILPFVSIVNEKERDLRHLLEDERHLRVRGFYGGSGERITEPFDIGICTIEKANSIINMLLEEKQLQKLSMIVVDELHLLADTNRGYLVEVLIICMDKTTTLIRGEEDIQIVAMSATIRKVRRLASWLDAQKHKTKYRPVEHTEMICYSQRNSVLVLVFAVDSKQIETVAIILVAVLTFVMARRHTRLELKNIDIDVFVHLSSTRGRYWIGMANCLLAACHEVIEDSVLIFCQSKKQCESVAATLAARLPQAADADDVDRATWPLANADVTAQKAAGKDNLPPYLASLRRCVRHRVAWHHADLHKEDRRLIEKLYRSGKVKALCATSTLAAGVNLPARRVIFNYGLRDLQGIRIGMGDLTPAQYKQMSGRAGRKGQGTIGESVVLCDTQKGLSLMNTKILPLESVLDQGGLRRLILEMLCV